MLTNGSLELAMLTRTPGSFHIYHIYTRWSIESIGPPRGTNYASLQYEDVFIIYRGIASVMKLFSESTAVPKEYLKSKSSTSCFR